MTWREFRIVREGRRGFSLSLPCFDDEAHPEWAERMNRFYEAAAEEMYQAALLAVGQDARRIHYRCLPEVREAGERIEVTLRLTLSVSGSPTRGKKLTHVWREGGIEKKTASPLL